MAEHKYAQVLRWVADGETVQHRLPESDASEWTDFQLDDRACRRLIKGTLGGGWQFRLKPRTVKIGSREVEAPVLEPALGAKVWFMVGATADAYFYNPGANPQMVAEMKRHGLLFASEEACVAFHRAWVEYVLGQLK